MKMETTIISTIIGILFLLVIWTLVYIVQSAPDCEYQTNRAQEQQLYLTCLERLQGMRQTLGGNYSTNDDEDLDEAINACSRQATNISSQMICK